MTKNQSPSSKQDAPGSGYAEPLTKAKQGAVNNISRVHEGLSELTLEDKKANARTQQFLDKLNREECSKFYSMISNDDFFNMFENYARNTSSTNQEVDDGSKSPFASSYVAGDEGQSTANDNVCYNNTDKARLYDEFFDNQYNQGKDKKYSSHTIPALQNKWGLQISPTIRSEQELNVVKVILHKQDRGNDPIARKKTRDAAVKALPTKISAGNLSCLLTSVAADEYDVTEDAISWQTILHCIHSFVLQYNMTSIIMIPQDVDLLHPHLVAKANKFKNAIIDWQDLQDADYFKWQEFVLRNSTEVEIESDNWLDEVLTLSMDNILRAEVESDIISIPKHQRGAITTLRCIIRRW